MATVIQNPDTDFAKELRKKIKGNNGYCISKFVKNKDGKCMCKEFCEQEEGMCECGLYIKYKD